MKVKIGDIINIKYQKGYWKGKVTKISEGYNEEIKYPSPIITVEEIGGVGHAVVSESELIFRNGEWYKNK